MPAGSFFLDTNIAVYYLNGAPHVVRAFHENAPIRLPFITAGELLYGAKKSARPTSNLETYRDFIQSLDLVLATPQTPEIYSSVKLQLESDGHPIPENDIWLAALAIEHEAVLVTNDAHFRYVAGLNTANWAGL